MDHILSLLIRIIVWVSGLIRYDIYRPGKKLKILLVGYNGARNTGADVRTVATAKQIKKLFGPDNVSLTVTTLDSRSLEGYFDDDVNVCEISSIFIFDLLRLCSANHAAVICEGSTLKSKFADALTLFMCEAAGIMGRQGKPCLAYGSEVGYMNTYLEKTAKKLCRDTYFITRTENSLRELKKLGLNGHKGTDTAWIYDDEIGCDEAEKFLKEQGWDGKRPCLGAAVIDPFVWPVRASLFKWFKSGLTGDHSGQYSKWYYYSDSSQRRKDYDRYIREVADAVGRFSKEKGFFPVIIGMEKLDKKACGDLKELLGDDCAVFLSGETGASVMTGILLRLSCIITSRYHAAVLSMKAGVPAVALSMDERLASLMEEMGMDDDLLHSVTDRKMGDKILESLDIVISDEKEIKARIRDKYLLDLEILEDMGKFLKGYMEGRPDER